MFKDGQWMQSKVPIPYEGKVPEGAPRSAKRILGTISLFGLKLQSFTPPVSFLSSSY